MRRIVASILIPVVIGATLGVIALVIVLSHSTEADEKGVPPELTAATEMMRSIPR